jgi:hypothetical protein
MSFCRFVFSAWLTSYSSLPCTPEEAKNQKEAEKSADFFPSGKEDAPSFFFTGDLSRATGTGVALSKVTATELHQEEQHG